MAFFTMLNLGESFGQASELEKKIPTLKGKEKVQALADLSYSYASVDVNKGIMFGRSAYQEAINLNDPAIEAQVLSDWSISYYNKGLYDSVLVLMEMAMPLARQSGNEILVAKVYNKMALAHFEKGAFQKALEENFKSLKVFESHNALAQVTQLNINIGAIYEKTQNFKEAENFYLKALNSTKLLNDSAIFVSVYGNLGVLYMKMEDFLRANSMYLNCLKYIDKKKELHFLCIIYQNIGVNCRNQGNINEGLKYYLKAQSVAQNLKSKSALAPILSNIGQCYLDLKDFKQGEAFLKEALVLAKEMNSNLEIRNVFKGLTRLEHLKGNYEKADVYFDQYLAYQDSVYSEKSNKALNEIAVKYKTEAKEKELLKERLKSSNLKNWIWILSLLSLIILLSAFSIHIKKNSEKHKLQIQSLKDLEFERMRISRDLHDNIGAELTLITSKLDIKAASASYLKEQIEFNELATLSREASILLRETIWSIRQDAISKGDLLEKIDQFARKRAGGQLEVISQTQSDHAIEIPSANALNLFRIAQEAINNAIKYSGGTRIVITLDAFGLEVADNGYGFDTNNFKHGYGIQNMKQRAEEMSAVFILTSDEKGACVRINLT